MTKAHPVKVVGGTGFCMQKLRVYYSAAVLKGQEMQELSNQFYNTDIHYELRYIRISLQLVECRQRKKNAQKTCELRRLRIRWLCGRNLGVTWLRNLMIG